MEFYIPSSNLVLFFNFFLKNFYFFQKKIITIDFTFQCLSDDYLRSITFVVYQLSHEPHYADQHLSDGELNIKVNKTSHDYLGGKIQLRRTSARKDFIWIKINQDNLQDPVVGWYCECKVSARKVGCCAHFAAII